MDVDAEGVQQGPPHRAGGNASRGLAGARPLENVARIGEPEFQHAGQVGMPRAYARDALGLEPAGFDLHRSFPVLPVAVLDDERHRGSERPASADAADDARGVLLDLLPLAPAVTTLAAAEVGIDVARGVE